jgi:hypothetical protein
MAEAEDTECPILTCKYNKTTHKKVTCCFCNASACRECYQTFLVGSIREPHCMMCSKEWSEAFVEDAFTKTWRLEVYRVYRRTVLMDRERVLLPEQQVYAEREVAARNKEEEAKASDDIVKGLREQQALIEQQIKVSIQIQITLRQEAAALRTGEAIPEPGKDRKQFVKKCPVEDCEGFLSSAWKCGICETWTCPECHEPRGKVRDAPGHVCNPDTVATVKLISTTTKPCPRCRTEIEKRSGCNQMWCTQCHCLWDFRTGEVDVGRNHNPEYMEYLRQANDGAGVVPRALGDNPCGGLPDAHILSNIIKNCPKKQKDYVLNALRTATHIELVCMVDVQRHMAPTDPVARFRKIAVSKLVGDLPKDEWWAEALEKADWEYSKNQRLMDIYQTVTLASADILQRLQSEKPHPMDLQTYVDQLEQMREIVNASLVKLHKAKAMAVGMILPDWQNFIPLSTAKKMQNIQPPTLVSAVWTNYKTPYQHANVVITFTWNGNVETKAQILDVIGTNEYIHHRVHRYNIRASVEKKEEGPDTWALTLQDHMLPRIKSDSTNISIRLYAYGTTYTSTNTVPVEFV